MAHRAKACPRITPFGTWLKDYPHQYNLLMQAGAPTGVARLAGGSIRHLLTVNRPIIMSIARREGPWQAGQVIRTLITHDRDLQAYLTIDQITVIACMVTGDLTIRMEGKETTCRH